MFESLVSAKDKVTQCAFYALSTYQPRRLTFAYTNMNKLLQQ